MKWFRVTAKKRSHFPGYGANGRYFVSGQPEYLPEDEIRDEIVLNANMFDIAELSEEEIAELELNGPVVESGEAGEAEADSLINWTRKELDARAAELGIDTAKMSSKQMVVDAIEAAEAETAETETAEAEAADLVEFGEAEGVETEEEVD